LILHGPCPPINGSHNPLDSEYIDVELVLELIVGYGFHKSANAVTSVVDRHIDAPHGVVRLLDGLIH
jgi:hypothetical protein